MSLAFVVPRVSLPRAAARARPCVAAKAKAGNWMPGSKSPAYLDGSLPGDYGFDPLKLVRIPFTVHRLLERMLGSVLPSR